MVCQSEQPETLDVEISPTSPQLKRRKINSSDPPTQPNESSATSRLSHLKNQINFAVQTLFAQFVLIC